MKIPYRWIREFVDLQITPEQAAARLINAGVEVESVTAIAPDVKGVVIGQIEAVERELGESHGHRLVLCRVSTGAQRFRVVCGAPNAVAGVRAAFAPPGAVLPGNRAINATAIRGVTSEGMLCSERELGLGDEHEGGILALEADAPLGTDLVSHLGLDDVVLEIEITPNRPDCLSVVGVARELSALTGAPFQPPTIGLAESDEDVNALAHVRIEAPDPCHRFTARVISDVTVAPSPAWMGARLRAVGLRPISNVVDVTNYVMWEIGHPLHAFDVAMVAVRSHFTPDIVRVTESYRLDAPRWRTRPSSSAVRARTSASRRSTARTARSIRRCCSSPIHGVGSASRASWAAPTAR